MMAAPTLRTLTLSGRQAAVTRSKWTASLTRRLTVGGAIGLFIVVLLILTATIGPTLVGDPTHQDLRARLHAPSTEHLLGTDRLGRDVLARVVAGARYSLLLGLVATLLSGAIGTLLGLVAGSLGGRTDRLIGFAADVQLALPFVLVAIALAATLGAGLGTVIATLVITGWVAYARIVRLQAAALRRSAFVEAAHASGAPPSRVLLRHIAPNLLGPVVVIASQQVAAMILFEAALSYLGLGVPASVITWGRMVADGREVLDTAWWVSAMPGLAIVLVVLGCNLLGDWQRDAFDPRSSLRQGQ